MKTLTSGILMGSGILAITVALIKRPSIDTLTVPMAVGLILLTLGILVLRFKVGDKVEQDRDNSDRSSSDRPSAKTPSKKPSHYPEEYNPHKSY